MENLSFYNNYIIKHETTTNEHLIRKTYGRNQRKNRQPYVEERKALHCRKKNEKNNALHITEQKAKDLKQALFFSLIKIRDKIAIQQKISAMMIYILTG